ncbi:BAG family molecular chaperone regulator 6-like, partial [Trifolium medium]|nr:BAG family molecular chaperone regulator 6-like [Trifolium medium]
STSGHVEEVPHTFKSVPVKSCVDEGVPNKTRSNDVGSTDISVLDVMDKVNNQRSIPAK